MTKRQWLLRIGAKTGYHFLMLVITIVIITPFIWMLATSLRDPSELLNRTIFWPRTWTLQNYVDAWRTAPFDKYYLNSVIVAAGTVLLQLITGSLAGYGFARVEMPGKNILFGIVLATMMVPNTVTLVPSYLLLNKLNWLNTYWALIIPWGATPFSIFLFRQFFRTIPRDIEDAARLDGCGRVRLLTRIMLPLSKPAMLTVATYGWIGSWNDFIWPLIMTDSQDMHTLQVGMSVFSQDAGTRYTQLMAAASFTIIPVLIAFFFVQRQFVEGVARSGITE